MTTPQITHTGPVTLPGYTWPAVATALALLALLGATWIDEWFTWLGAGAWLAAAAMSWANTRAGRDTARYLNSIRAELNREN